MNHRPWPVVLLSALGAWLSAIPFFAVAAMILEPLLKEQAGALVTGLIMLGGAVALLRLPQRSMFVENLGVPVLLAGLILLGWGMEAFIAWEAMFAVVSLLMLALSFVLPQTWVRALLGALASQCLLLATSSTSWWRDDHTHLSPWAGLHLLVLLWLVSIVLNHMRLVPAAAASALTEVGNGWVASTLLAMAWWSGSTFLLSQPLGIDGAHTQGSISAWWSHARLDLGSLSAALLAAACLALRWRDLHQFWCAALATVLCVLAAFMPALGGVMLVASTCLLTHRTRMALWAGVVAMWVVGAFYYQLTWPLATKALILVVAGMLLGMVAYWGWHASTTGTTSHRNAVEATAVDHSRPWVLGMGLLAALIVSNAAIWHNENLIQHGRPVFVALAPVDPRSLMQGDYMTLRFDMTGVNLSEATESDRVQLVLSLDKRGVATAVRLHQGEALKPSELIMQLAHKNGGWILVTDAFYFKEGEAQRWSGARFGEFRVEPDGRALLVGLRGPQLERL